MVTTGAPARDDLAGLDVHVEHGGLGVGAQDVLREALVLGGEGGLGLGDLGIGESISCGRAPARRERSLSSRTLDSASALATSRSRSSTVA